MTLRSRCRAAVLLPAVLLALAACGTDADPEPVATSAAASPTPTTTPNQTPTPTPSPGPTPSDPSATSSPPDSGLRALLPEADDLPGLNAQWRWSDSHTGPTESEPFGVCAKFDVLTLGAERAVLRRYDDATGTTEVQAEAIAVQFPDAMTVKRAQQVLSSWHRDCEKRIRDIELAEDPQVRPNANVEVPGAQASWYLASWALPTPDDGHFHAFGMVTRGSRMVLLTMDSAGQDYNYPPGQEPMALALPHVASLLQ